MKTKIFTVYDSKVAAYMAPFFMDTTGRAMRSFEDTANDPSSVINKHPHDFVLFEIGIFDDADATITMYENRVMLSSAHECIAQNEMDLSQVDISHVS